MTPSGWSVNVKSYSSTTLAELYRLLAEQPDKDQRVAIQRELVARAVQRGLTTAEILKILASGVATKRERAKIARQWYEALGTTAAEAIRLVG
jgi:predicted nucleic acid-binding Zn ribbon protein